MSTRRPRYRYIAFRLEGPRAFRREEVQEAMRASTPRLWLVDFEGTSGLARTTHIERDAAIRTLNGINQVAGERVRLTTIGTSGTIRAATRKYMGSANRVQREQEKNPYK